MTARSDVGTLEASGLIGLAAMEPELEYLFRHVLVQDAAYASLLKQERRELHRRVAEALLELYPERRAELAGVIGMHFEEAGDALRAGPLLVEAGEHALARFAYREARAFFDRAIAALPSDTRDPAVARLRLRAGIASVKAGWTFVPGAADISRLGQLVPIADQMGDARLSSEVHFWNAHLRRSTGETPETSKELRRSIERLDELGAEQGDRLARALPEALRGGGLVLSGQIRRGAELLERAIPPIEESGDVISTGELYQMLTLAYARLGEFAAAERNAVRADRLAERGDPIARLDATITRAMIASERGDLEEAVGLAERCTVDSEQLGATMCAIPANYLLGDGHLRLDEAPKARPPFERMLQLAGAESDALSGFGALGRAGLSAALARLGQGAGAAADWDVPLEQARRVSDPYTEATILALRARTLARTDPSDLGPALAGLEAAMSIFEQIEACPALARALRAYSEILGRAGRAEEARSARERAATISDELGLRDRDSVA